MRRSATSIRSRIFISIASILLLSFALVGIFFNFIATQFIRSSAIDQLNFAIETFDNAFEILPVIPAGRNDAMIRDGSSANLFRMKANTLAIDTNYEYLQDDDKTETHEEIRLALKASEFVLGSVTNQMLRTENGVYYVTVIFYPRSIMSLDSYVVHYVDVTGLTNFSNQVNIILLMISCVTCLIAGFFSIFLSGSIAKPIKMLSNYAIRIGQGDFSHSGCVFTDEELEGLNKSLNQAARQLGLYDKEQKTFFQNASHELRTPLMSIKCYAEGIEYGLMDPVMASKTIIAETDRLTGMVEDLLYISKVDNITTDFVMEKVDLRELVRISAGQQAAVAQLKNINFVFEFDENCVYCSCASKLMAKAVSNLISNAIRYAETCVTLTCTTSGTKAVISVADDGKGIEIETLPRIFERFIKGKNGNHGIGLSIAKSVVSQHGGNITAENAEKGAVFTIELPGGEK